MSKINILPIIDAHLDTLRDDSFGGRSTLDYVVFIGLPVCLGVVLDVLHYGFRVDAVNGLLSAFAILSGLMLNLLVLVFTLASSTSPLSLDVKLRKRVLNEVFVNICFSILVAIAVVVTAVIALSYMRSIPGARTGIIATFFLSSCTFNFILTVLMILKRMYAILHLEIDRSNTSKRAA